MDVIELVWDDRLPRITSDGGGDSASLSVAENQLPVTTAAATDPELDAVSFSLSGSDSQLLELVGSALRFRSPPDFEAPQDLGRNNVYDVTLVATDAFGETDEQELAITVTDVNDAPVLAVISPVSVMQSTTRDVEIVSATDQDQPPQTLTFSLGGTDGADFDLVPDPQGQKLTFVSLPVVGAPADANGDNVYELTVTVNDGAGASTTRPVQVTVRAASVLTVGLNDQLSSEGQSGTAQMLFTVTLSLVAAQTVTVDYATLDATAAAGSDYVAQSGTITFAPNQRIKTIAIGVMGDTAVEDDETFRYC